MGVRMGDWKTLMRLFLIVLRPGKRLDRGIRICEFRGWKRTSSWIGETLWRKGKVLLANCGVRVEPLECGRGQLPVLGRVGGGSRAELLAEGC
jgi:hypothetical protein